MSDSSAERIARHLNGLSEASALTAREIAADIAKIATLVQTAFTHGSKLMFCGNGGSAADAQHLATEYVVRFRRNRNPLAALALTTDTSLITAAANDLGFEQIFARQVAAHGRRGDILFLHTTSGVSPNLLAAANAAKGLGVISVGMFGRTGGPLRDVVDHAIMVPSDVGAHVQELHLAIGHAICDLVEEQTA